MLDRRNESGQSESVSFATGGDAIRLVYSQSSEPMYTSRISGDLAFMVET